MVTLLIIYGIIGVLVCIFSLMLALGLGVAEGELALPKAVLWSLFYGIFWLPAIAVILLLVLAEQHADG